MHTLQPVLVPCKGTLADLHVEPDPSDPKCLSVYWGTADEFASELRARRNGGHQ